LARNLTPFGRFLLLVGGLALIGYGLWRYGVLERVARVLAPDRKSQGTVTKDDFGPVSPGGTAPAASKASLAGGSRLPRPPKVAIVTWGGYAGGIVANGGFAPNKDSVFTRDYQLQVELLVIDDFEKSRDAFRGGGDKGGVDVMWSTVDAFALEYDGLRKLNPKAILQYDWGRGGGGKAGARSLTNAARPCGQ